MNDPGSTTTQAEIILLANQNNFAAMTAQFIILRMCDLVDWIDR